MTETAEETRLRRISTLLSRGDLLQAEAECRDLLAAQPGLVSALHLLGLTRARQGDAAEAERLLRRCVDLVPDNADFHGNLGNFLRRNGRLREADAAYHSALTLRPDDRRTRRSLALTRQDLGLHDEAEATILSLLRQDESDPDSWLTLGCLLIQQSRFAQAEAALRRALTLRPAQGIVEHNLAQTLASTDRGEEALEALEQAAAHGVRGYEWQINRGRALIGLARIDAAIDAFSAAVAERPEEIDGQLMLARLRHLRGDVGYDEAIARATKVSGNPELHWLEADILRRSRCLSAAEERIRAAIARLGKQPRLLHGLAQILLAQNRLADAESAAIDAVTALPDDGAAVENLIAILLARGLPGDALEFIERWRVRAPLDQTWMAYEATTLRLLGKAGSETLNDYGRFVRLYDLAAPSGWTHLEPFNAEVAAELEPKLTLDHAPFEQDPRSGRRNACDLIWSRAAPVQRALQCCAELLPAYLADVGAAADHPLIARASGSARISSAWAVELRQGGYHGSQIQPRGWISGVYYVSVPEASPESDAERDGWLKLGQPPHSDPKGAPDCLVQPRPGRLVLFPSFFWHGTQPVTGTEPHLAIWFDATPIP